MSGHSMMTTRRTLLSASLLLALLSAPASAASITLQPQSALSYVPSLPGNALICALYAIFAITLFWFAFRDRAWWALCLPIGCFFSSLGFALRIVLREPQWQGESSIFIPMYLFVVLPPACFLAFAYIVGGRLIVAVTAMDSQAISGPVSQVEEKVASSRHWWGGRKTITPETRMAPLGQKSPFSILPPRLYTFIFVLSDVITFIIQATGASLQTSEEWETVLTGTDVYLGGAVVQMVSYVFFVLVVGLSHWRIYRTDPETYSLKRAFVKRNPAAVLFLTLHCVGIFILIRSAFRTAEMAQGVTSIIYNTEIYTFLLDALPLLVAVAIFIPFWPKKLLDNIAPSESIKKVLKERKMLSPEAQEELEMGDREYDQGQKGVETPRHSW